ncbi:hypothetical protein CRG98_032600 [Punica granatum]|uniref:Uncharacterized protein n=1 Tax=Punica granatum TaxID=22663 RepID=A0A2I0ISJ4_PUNGR|nr:hypothetical protein CRG98_032600 [Punica granatum]
MTMGRKKIDDGKNMAPVLEEEKQNLGDKLKELGKGSSTKDTAGPWNCSNFDLQVMVLQRGLDKLGSLSEGKRVEKICKMAEESQSITTSSRIKVKGKNMVKNGGIIKGHAVGEDGEGIQFICFYRRQFGFKFCLSIEASRMSRPLCFLYLSGQPRDVRSQGGCCYLSGHCKAVVRRIVEQVWAETEQWSQPQDLLGQMRD